MQFELRTAHLKEAFDLVRIHFDAVHSISVVHYPLELLESWSPAPSEARTEWMQQVIRSTDRLVLIAHANDSPLGFSICAPDSSFIHALYVQPGRFGMGIGRGLLAACESAIAGAGPTTSMVFASHNAVPFYAASGYVAEIPVTQPLSDGSQLVCTQMRKRLPPNNSLPSLH